MRKLSLFDLISLSILVLIAIFSVIRFNYLPQFVDGYYHLSVANGFIKSNGWSGWAWWDFAPFGRPHLYPPIYHFILVFLMKAGISGLNALRLTEVAITPLLFFFLWLASRKLINDKFAFLNLISTASFFAFYSSVSANVPASLAIIFGSLTWLFIKKKKWVSAAVFMSLCFYTHAGLPWIFFASLLAAAIFNREYRIFSIKTASASFVLFMPFLFHELHYLSYVNLNVLAEAKFISFNIAVIIFGLIFMCRNLKNKEFAVLLFWGYLIGSLIAFIKYPYRFFSAQGFIGFAFFSSLGLTKLFEHPAKKQKLFLVLISLYLVFINATFSLDNSKIRLNLSDSTFYNFVSGKIYNDTTFRTIFSEKFFLPVVKSIQQNSSANDIIWSNNPVPAQIISSLSNRASGNSMLGEVRGKERLAYPDYARLVILMKPLDKKDLSGFKGKTLKLVFENDIAYIFLNESYIHGEFVGFTPFNFTRVCLVLWLLLFTVIIDNSRAKNLKLPQNIYRFFKPK